jgi:general stress protein 26
MTKEEIVRTAQEMTRTNRVFVLATVDEEGRPQVRWIGGCVLDEPMTLWMATGADSRKLHQIRAHPQAQVMFHAEGYTQVATITGTCEADDSMEPRRRLWEAIPELSHYVSSPEDPSLAVIKFVGSRVELMSLAAHGAPEVAEL